VKIILFTVHTDGVNQALASTFGIDLVISKSDNILTLREHLIALLVSVNSPTRATDLRKNTRIIRPKLGVENRLFTRAHQTFSRAVFKDVRTGLV
jgi:hypothetical protein